MCGRLTVSACSTPAAALQFKQADQCPEPGCVSWCRQQIQQRGLPPVTCAYGKQQNNCCCMLHFACLGSSMLVMRFMAACSSDARRGWGGGRGGECSSGVHCRGAVHGGVVGEKGWWGMQCWGALAGRTGAAQSSGCIRGRRTGRRRGTRRRRSYWGTAAECISEVQSWGAGVQGVAGRGGAGGWRYSSGGQTSGRAKGATYSTSTKGSAKSQRRAIWLFSLTWGLDSPCRCPSLNPRDGRWITTCFLS